MSREALAEFIEQSASTLDIPGVAVGVWADGRETLVCRGITSIDNPLPVDQDTLFVLGSVTKTYTATALMALVAQGRVDLQAPVRRYVPELRLSDEASDEVTVLQLLNHTSGLGWDLIVDTGAGDDALARYVTQLANLEQIAPPGTRASYSQAGYCLAGRIIETVVDRPYEHAIASLLFEPLGLAHSHFAPEEVMIRRFAMGHNPSEDGVLASAQMWKGPRCRNPGAGIASSVSNLLRWARFHLSDGRVEGADQILDVGFLRQMKEKTVALRGSTLGDAFGICWFLREIDGVPTVGHGGSANGQFAELIIVPDRDFAAVALSNAGPEGYQCNQSIVRWALETYLGIVERDPEPLPYSKDRASEFVGDFEIDAMNLKILLGDQGMTLEVGIKPEIRAASETELPPDYSAASIGLLPGDTDEYIVTSGGLKGQRGFFTRNELGAVTGVDLAGRLFTRATATSP